MLSFYDVVTSDVNRDVSTTCCESSSGDEVAGLITCTKKFWCIMLCCDWLIFTRCNRLWQFRGLSYPKYEPSIGYKYLVQSGGQVSDMQLCGSLSTWRLSRQFCSLTMISSSFFLVVGRVIWQTSWFFMFQMRASRFFPLLWKCHVFFFLTVVNVFLDIAKRISCNLATDVITTTALCR